MSFEKEFLDVNGFVLPGPSPSGKPSDNGVLFTSIAKIFGFDFPNYKEMIRSCYLEKGLMARWPYNNFDQAQWDDYLGVAVCCIFFGIRDIPREILWYGIKHGFFFNTDGKRSFKDFIGRNFPIWPLMFCAAFPYFRFLMFIPLYFIQLFFKKPDINDSSGAQLQWIYFIGCSRLGFNFKKSEDYSGDYVKRILYRYYHPQHPFNKM